MVYQYADRIIGVDTHPLKVITDERGAVMHMLRNDSPYYKDFGEIYFSQVNAGYIKGWKRHKRMSQNFAVPFGQLALIILDKRKGSTTEDCYMTCTLGMPNNYVLVTIPPNVWYAFYAMTEVSALLANCADLAHDPQEAEQVPIDTFEIDAVFDFTKMKT